MYVAWLALADIGGEGQGREKVLLRFHICRMLYSGGGGGEFRNFWGGMCRWDNGTLSLYQSKFSWILLPYTNYTPQIPPVLE